jgi:hypothetical protein
LNQKSLVKNYPANLCRLTRIPEISRPLRATVMRLSAIIQWRIPLKRATNLVGQEFDPRWNSQRENDQLFGMVKYAIEIQQVRAHRLIGLCLLTSEESAR